MVLACLALAGCGLAVAGFMIGSSSAAIAGYRWPPSVERSYMRACVQRASNTGHAFTKYIATDYCACTLRWFERRFSFHMWLDLVNNHRAAWQRIADRAIRACP